MQRVTQLMTRKATFIFLVVVITVLILNEFFIPKQQYEAVPGIEKGFDYLAIEDAHERGSVKGGAYVFLALGAQTVQMNCPAAIESLVRYAGWDGPVYMLTDRSACYDREQILKDSGIKSENLRIVDVQGSFGSGGLDLEHGTRKQRMKSMSIKASLFDYIEDQSINLITYADCDILFGIQGCAAEYMTIDSNWDKSKLKFSHIYLKGDTFNGIHCGTFIAHREHSKVALELWKRELDKLVYEGDNDAYTAAYRQLVHDIQKVQNDTSMSKEDKKAFLDKYNPKGVNVLLGAEVKHPGDRMNTINWYEKFVSLHDYTARHQNVRCMTHIPKARCNRFGRDSMQVLVDRFDLRTYDGDYKYCTHPYLQPLLYGWFPFNYLPFCPKLEKIL